MAKPEANFIQRVHRKLAPKIYKQAMGLTASNGSPDYYYEGPHGAMWIEYKWYASKPGSIKLATSKSSPKLSPLQLRWLNRAYLNNVEVYVVAGYPGGAFILDNSKWNDDLNPVEPYDCPIEEVVALINGLANSNRNRRSSVVSVKNAVSRMGNRS
jgi:hypothetical protein